MDKTEYESLLKQAEATKEEAIRLAVQEYGASVFSIKRVWTLLNGQAPKEQESPKVAAQSKARTMKPRDMIRWAIKTLDEFSNPIIVEAIKQEYKQEIPSGTISQFLNKLKRTGKIVQIGEGGGRAAHRYRKAITKSSDGKEAA